MNKKLLVLSLIFLSFMLSGYRGSGRVGTDNEEKNKTVKTQTTLQSNVSVVIDGRAYWFAKGTSCTVISAWDDPDHGPMERIEVSGVRWDSSATVCD